MITTAEIPRFVTGAVDSRLPMDPIADEALHDEGLHLIPRFARSRRTSAR